jgi:ech hydrogenase subunit D
MKRIETTLENIKPGIRDFYDETLHHFIVMNAVDKVATIEVQWFFCEYAYPSKITAFCAEVTPGTEIPSISDIVVSAWVAEAELVDLMDISIENTARGFVLEPDFKSGPLRKKK